MRSIPELDGRVRKTRLRLHDALVSLIHEKNYQSIIVNEILERADVGRSAFYAHFQNKDALLRSSIERVLRSMPAREPTKAAGVFGQALSFSFPLFAYIGQCRGSSRLRMSRTGRTILHRHLRRVLVQAIAGEVEAAKRLSPRPTSVPTELLTEFIIGTFVLVLTWWVERERPVTPQEIDDLFLGLVAPALAAA